MTKLNAARQIPSEQSLYKHYFYAACYLLPMLRSKFPDLVVLSALLLLVTGLKAGMKSDSLDRPKTKLLRDVAIFPVPVVFRFPETGWGGGAAMTSAFSFTKDSSWAKPSQLSAGITYTQNKQILFFIPFNLFLNNNQYYLNGDNGWFRFNFYYYGIGE